MTSERNQIAVIWMDKNRLRTCCKLTISCPFISVMMIIR